MSHPKKLETVHIETVDDELCLYDWQRKQVHALNPTAAMVWEMCDGQTSPTEMAARMQTKLETSHAEELVWMSLERLEKAQLLENGVVKPANGKMMTRRQMLKSLGVAVALLPVVSSIVAPGPVAAQSPAGSDSLGVVAFWRPISSSCASGDGFFDSENVPASELNAEATAVCGGPFEALVQNTSITDCADCYNAAVAAGADWYRFGQSEVGLCQAHRCLSAGAASESVNYG